ncbi:unnamed protein product [Cylicocyclus nassatus]|uniref:Uncharacterized protein n=1 Tax=Cylicocyclus nassatus TaxID=53992 RepID=A0AA36DSP0_CYLNA|nr:unnamed protein product [Cylicocyclus nassatus]
MRLPLLAFLPLIAAESFVYLHPVNPNLHPRDMYPIQRSLRGFNKVRDLPQSGIVYLHRIKPLSNEFKGTAVARADNTFVSQAAPAPLRELGAELKSGDATISLPSTESFTTKQSPPLLVPASTIGAETVGDSASVERVPTTESQEATTQAITTTSEEMIEMLPTMPPIQRTTTEETEMPTQRPEKNMLKIAISKKKNIEPKEYDLSRQAEVDLERLIAELKEQEAVDLIEEHPAAATIDLPRAVISGRRTRPGNNNARLVPLSGTARLHVGEFHRKRSDAKLVQLKKRKSFGRVGATATAQRGPDFDPWERERMGQGRTA